MARKGCKQCSKVSRGNAHLDRTVLGPRIYFMSPCKACERPPVPPPPLCADCGEILPVPKEEHRCRAKAVVASTKPLCRWCNRPSGEGHCVACKATREGTPQCSRCGYPVAAPRKLCYLCVERDLVRGPTKPTPEVALPEAKPALGRIAAVALEVFDGETKQDFEPRKLPEQRPRQLEVD